MTTMTIEPPLQGPGHHALLGNVLKAMDERNLTQKQLAHALQMEKSMVSKILSGTRKLTAVEVGMLVGVTGWSAGQLIGIEPRQAGTTWNPLFQEPKELFNVWAAHQSQRNEIIAFDHNVVCSATTQVVHEKRDARLFEPLTWTDGGKLILNRFGEFARMRRQRYLSTDESTAPKITSLMLRSDFERLVHRKEPYQDCTATEVWQCLKHLRDDCVDTRRFRLVLLDESKIEANLRRYLSTIDSLAVIGRTLVVTRGLDFSISFFDNADAVRQGLERLRMLVTSAGLHPDGEIPKKPVLAFLDEYIDCATKQMREELAAAAEAR